MYLLKWLRDQGLAVKQLNIVFESLVVNRIRYAILAELRGTINAVSESL